MVRFIFMCMAVVAIAVAAIPGMQMMNGIVKEQQKSMEMASGMANEAAAELALEQDATSPEDLNKIESAAGSETPDYGNEEIPGGFNNIAPSAFGEPAVQDAIKNTQE